MNNSFFQEKTAVVTGAGGTICSALAKGLAEKGTKVALFGRTQSSLQTVADEITNNGGTALPVLCDVTDEESVSAAYKTVKKELGTTTLLINGAGGNQNRAVTTVNEFTPEELSPNRPEELRGFFNIDLDSFQSVITANTLGTIIPIRVFGKDMTENGGGSIVNFASMNSYCPLTRNAAYAISKAGIMNVTQWLAAYLAPANIRVNAIAPGFFPNNRSRAILGTPETGLKPRGQKVMDHTPMKRFGEPRELLGATCWLLNDEQAAFVTGITVPVDGGFLTASGI